MKEITVQELKQKLDNNEDIQLIDVREEYEYDICNLNGELIPMGTIIDQPEKISRDRQVVIHCKSGNRSGVVIQEMERRYGFTNLYNLRGGILAYGREIDPAIMPY
jgi:rhodanese-related sulfurtransferase